MITGDYERWWWTECSRSLSGLTLGEWEVDTNSGPHARLRSPGVTWRAGRFTEEGGVRLFLDRISDYGKSSYNNLPGVAPDDPSEAALKLAFYFQVMNP